jgi:CysZ protein
VWRSVVNVGSVATVTDAPTTAKPRRGLVREFLTGIGLALRGQVVVLRAPGLWLLGVLPALITFLLLLGGFVALAAYDDRIAAFITPYADTWSSWQRDTLRLAVELALIVVWVVVSVVLFASLTLIIGEPFYEAISKRIDDSLGGIRSEQSVRFWRQLPRSIMESARLLLLTAFNAIIVFLVTLVPVAGQFGGPVLGAFLGGWVITLELTSVPFERRGLVLRHRRQLLRRRRWLAYGFGVTSFIFLLIPGVDVLLMPGAVAGATLLSRRVFDEPGRTLTVYKGRAI